MADYSVDIQASLKGFEKLDEYERKINELSNKKVKVQFDAKGIDKLLKSSGSKGVSSSITERIFNTADLKKNGKLYFSKVANTLNALQPSVEKSLKSKGYSNISIVKGIEDAEGKIKSFIVTAKDVNGVLKQLEFQRNKIQGNGKAQAGFVQTDDVKVLKTAIEQEKKTQAQANKYRQKAQQQQIKQQQKEIQTQNKANRRSYSKQYWDNWFNDNYEKTDQQKQLSDYYKQQEKESEKYYKKYNSLQNKFNNTNSNFGNLKTNISSAGKSNLGEYAYDQLASKINKAEQALANFNAESTKGSNANLDSMNASLKEFNTLTTSASKQYEKLMQPVDRLSQNKMLNDFKSYWKENTKAHKDFSPDYESIVSELENTKLTSGRSSELKKQIASFKSEIKSSGKEGKSWISDTKRALGQIAQFTGVYAALQNVMVELPSQMMTAVKDVDAAKIELTKVSDAPTSQLSDYWNEAAESAKKYGATISDVISSTADWKRLGYNLNDSETLSDATSLMQKVGDDMTQESSAEGIISTLKGFGMNASDVNKIIDSVNEVSNTQPIATNGLFEGLKRSASSMSAANNSLSQTIGLITAANSVVQDPASVGTAFKTISMRIRGATTELEDAGLDTEGMASSTAKLREEIQALSGVDIMKNDTTFKSTYDILDELASKWQNLTDIQQASITELIAGKRQGNIVSGLMKNFDIARQSYNTAEFGSEGSAEKELSNYQKSIEYHIGQMKASFQELSTTAVNSDVFKGFIDGGTTAINVLTKFISVANGVPAVLTAIGAVKAFKNLD